jgi:hypothetical protein
VTNIAELQVPPQGVIHPPSVDDVEPQPLPRRGTGRKIVALIPAGEVHDKTSVRAWSHADPARDVQQRYNAGDMFVYEASLRLLDFDEMEAIPLQSDWDQRTIDRLNAEAQYCFVRGSNYIHHEMKWGNLPTLLEKLKIPVVAFGIGAQAPTYKDVRISADTQRFLKIVSERSKKVGVRGAFSAEVLKKFGVDNVEVIGCPSLMRHNRPRLDIKVGSLADVRRVGFTLTRGLWPMYCEDPKKARAMQREMILEYAKRFDLTVISQGEQLERAYWYRQPAEIALAYAALVENKWFTGPDDPMIEVYEKNLFFGASPRAYEELSRQMDLVLGFRLHGNIMALANGVPAVYVVYDSRTRELVEYLGIPAYDIADKEPFKLESYYTQARFDHFNARYVAAYRRMAEFLDANGVPHLMRP